MKKTERFLAASILKAVLQQKTPLSHAMQQSGPLTPFIKEICFGMLRYYLTLEKRALTLLHKRPKDFDVWLVILIGLYQLQYLDIAEYAVVHETVDLLDQLKKNWAKGLVNAILRRYCREHKGSSPLVQDMNSFDNHPLWLREQIKKAWPKNWESILKANDTHPCMSLRVNQRQTDARSYISLLESMNIQAERHPFAPHGIILKQACAVQELPGFTEGYVSVQDCAAQLATTLLNLQPGLRVLDACCAPGGKTGAILESEPDIDVCIALDIEAKRLKRVEENLSRLKMHASIKQGDVLNPETWWDGSLFDRILLDAPCSATGVIRRHPDIKLLRTPEEIRSITILQQQMLETLWPMLTCGGILVYATCSIIPKENEDQIAAFVKNHTDCEIDQAVKSWGHWTGNGWQILPGEDDMDGFFYSVLRKSQTGD